jgi:hypothetical protein
MKIRMSWITSSDGRYCCHPAWAKLSEKVSCDLCSQLDAASENWYTAYWEMVVEEFKKFNGVLEYATIPYDVTVHFPDEESAAGFLLTWS